VHFVVLSFPADSPRPQAILWLLLSLNSSAEENPSVGDYNTSPSAIFMTWFIRIIPINIVCKTGSKPELQDSHKPGRAESQSHKSRRHRQDVMTARRRRY
jgi:hypothetical protein